MADEHEWRDNRSDHDLESGDETPGPKAATDISGESGDEVSETPESPLLSAEQFDNELARLESEEEELPGDEQAGESDVLPDQPVGAYLGADDGLEPESDAVEALDDDERLRGPRAQTFRRRLRDQLSMLPLAAWLVALGAFLLAREQKVDGLPDLSTLALGELSVLAVATTMIMHSLLSGRRERGLLFLGLWVWATAGMVAVLVYGIDSQPDAKQWWPLIIWSLSLTLLLTYLLERTHDARLLLLSTVVLVAGVTAYAVTSERIEQELLDQAEDYWPLLFSILGVVLLPLVFRRRPVGR